MSEFETTHLRRGFDFLMAAYGVDRWRRDRAVIEEHLLLTLAQRGRPEEPDLPASLSFKQHPLAWYLYLVETLFDGSYLYEVAQGARVIPLVGRLGMELDRLTKVGGVDARLAGLVADAGGDPDGTLFELLVAAAYVRNGWRTVELLEEQKSNKTPDLRLVNEGREVFAECKRFRASSTYALAERDQFWRMWTPVGRMAIAEQLSLAIDVTFHRELEHLPVEILVEQLGPRLLHGAKGAVQIQTAELTATVKPARLQVVQEQLKQGPLRWPSSLALELLMGRFERFRQAAFTANVKQSSEFPMFVDAVSAATCVTWTCDDENGVRKKARHIRRVLSEDTAQLPAGSAGIVHIGIEALDGDLVERRRFEAIKRELARFDPGDKRLEWVYCHVFAPYVPPHKNFEFDETAFWASSWNGTSPPPLSRSQTLVVPDELTTGHGVHWAPRGGF